MNKILLGMALSWSCWAQTAGPTPGQTSAQLQADLRGDPDPDVDARPKPNNIFGPAPFEMPPTKRERPTDPSISVSQLQHKVSKEAGRSFKHAQKLSRAGNHGLAASELEKVVRDDPAFSQAETQLGLEYAQVGRLGDAETAFRDSLKTDPSSWNARYNLGLVLYCRGDLAGAVEDVRQALLSSKQNTKVYLFLGYQFSLLAEEFSGPRAQRKVSCH